jgi:Protein of unknown function (DUF2867)
MLPFQIAQPAGSPNARSVASHPEASVETLEHARIRILARFRTRRELVRWSAVSEYVDQAHAGVEETGGAAETWRIAALIPTTQTVLASVVTVISRANDSNGELGGLAHELLSLRAELCNAEPPKPAALVEWLIGFRFGGTQDFFEPDIAHYTDALGPRGLFLLGQRLDALEAALPPADRGPGLLPSARGTAIRADDERIRRRSGSSAARNRGPPRAPPLLWVMRGWMDRIVGGVGLKRGRRNQSTVSVGDAIDFWRVEMRVPERMLRLRAEMKLPGLAWLELGCEEQDGRLVYRQRAIFFPRGLSGRLYWWSVLPFHGLIVAGMLSPIVAIAEAETLTKTGSKLRAQQHRLGALLDARSARHGTGERFSGNGTEALAQRLNLCSAVLCEQDR